LAEVARLLPGLVVTDVAMPGRSGLGLCRDIRRDWPALPVIAITARDLNHDERQMLTNVLCDLVLTKPCSPAAAGCRLSIAWPRQRTGRRRRRSGTCCASQCLGCSYWSISSASVWSVCDPRPRSPATCWLAGLFVVGAMIAGWVLVTFKRARTATVPGQMSSRLVMWGPYRFTRNPMYVGLTPAYLGEAGLLQELWPVVLLPQILVYVNGVVIPLEERQLLDAFDGPYDDYRACVRRWL
jgi:protein-S-isoprenylcysteine O-methyltransferase Ste14